MWVAFPKFWNMRNKSFLQRKILLTQTLRTMLYARNNKILYKMHLAKMEAELQPLKIGVQQNEYNFLWSFMLGSLCMSLKGSPFEFPENFLRFHQIRCLHHFYCIMHTNIFHNVHKYTVLPSKWYLLPRQQRKSRMEVISQNR